VNEVHIPGNKIEPQGPFLDTLVLAAGCATILTGKGALVRVTNQVDQVKDCKYLGQVTSSSSWGGFAATGIAFDNALNELKNKAAEMGGNVLLTQVISNTMGGTRMLGDAYYCQNHVSQ